MKDGGFIFSQLACEASEMPRDPTSVSALQFLVVIHCNPVRQNSRDKGKNRGRFLSAVYSLGFCSVQF